MILRGRGYKPNTPEHRAARPKYLRAASSPDEWLALVPICADVAPAWDQGQTGSCTGHGSSDGITIAFAAAGAPLGFRCSPSELYRNGRAIDRVFVNGRPSTPLTDDGAMPAQVIRAANEIGVRPTKAADGVSSDADPATINDEPTVADVEVERLVVPLGEYGIESVSEGASLEELEASVRGALANNRPVGIACNADGAFQDYTGPGVYSPPANVPPPDHWVSLVGYMTSSSTGQSAYLLKNSWGADWGTSVTFAGKTLHGVMWVSRVFLATCEDLTVYVPEKAV